MTKQELFTEADVIHTYSRAQAIEDGVLVDLMQPETVKAVREAGFKFPVAMTSAAFHLAVWPIVDDAEVDDADDTSAEKWLKSRGQDLQGRLWDVLWMLRCAIKAQPKAGPWAPFNISVQDWESRRRRVLRLKSICGPGDAGEPVLTIMLPDED